MKKLHRYLGLVMALFWLAQAVTGVILVFRWELDDVSVGGTWAPADAQALGSRIDAIAQEGGQVSSVWSNSMGADRFDITYTDAAGAERVMRVDGAGHVFRDRPDDMRLSQGGVYDVLTRFHHSLFVGSTGVWIVAISGLLLLSNLIFGLKLALPRLAMWRRALFAKPAGNSHAQLYGWHRVVGLWGTVPALLIVAAGVLIVIKDEVGDALGASVPTPVAPAASGTNIGAAQVGAGQAIAIALDRFPGSTLTALSMPGSDEPWYRIRVRAPEEISRMWGTTTVFVSAEDGRIISAHPAETASTARSFAEFVYPLHTGQIAGTGGRMALLLIGAWLITMIVLGTKLWYSRNSRVSAQPQR